MGGVMLILKLIIASSDGIYTDVTANLIWYRIWNQL